MRLTANPFQPVFAFDFNGGPVNFPRASAETSFCRVYKKGLDPLVNEWIAEQMAESDPPRERDPRVFGEVNAPDQLLAGPRSIFDDVDA